MGLFNFSFKRREKTENLEHRLEFSKRLLVVTNMIHATNNIDEIMLDLSKEICALFHCDRLTLYAVSADKKSIYSKVKTGIDSKKDLVLPVGSQTIAGHVVSARCCVRIRDAYDEKELKAISPELRFGHQVDQVTGYRTRQVLAAPVIDARNREILGAMQLINNRPDWEFSEEAEIGLTDLCDTLAVAFIQRMKSTAQPTRSKYEALVVDALLSAPELELAARWAKRKGLDLEDVLVEDFKVPLEAIGQSLAKAFRVPYEPFKDDLRKPQQLFLDGKARPRSFYEKAQWVPVEETDIGIVLLSTDPELADSSESVKAVYPYSRHFFRIATHREFRQTLDLFFPAKAG